jgi:predicted GNAT family N-acyltransferase
MDKLLDLGTSIPRVNDDSAKFAAEDVQRLLNTTFWAVDRTLQTVQTSLKNSLCFGIFYDAQLVAFARVVTDKCTFAYLCDVVVDEKYRGRGFSKLMMNQVMNHPDLQQFRRFLLATKDAHGLYAKYGFSSVDEKFFMQIINEGV